MVSAFNKTTGMIGLRLVCAGSCIGAGAFFICMQGAFGQVAVTSAPVTSTVRTPDATPEATGREPIIDAPMAGDGQAPPAPLESRPNEAAISGETGYSSAPRRFHYKLQAEVGGIYDDNINFTGTDRVKDFYLSISPRAIIGVGDLDERHENYLRLEYAPHVLIFADHSDNNAFEQAIRAAGQYRFERLKLQLFQDIQVIDSADVAYRTNLDEVNNRLNLDVSGRTRLNIFTTGLMGEYDLSSKTFVSAALTNTVQNYMSSSLLDSQVAAGTVYLNYRYSTKLVIGLGGGGGYEKVDPPTPDQTFEQANVRVFYEVRGKLVFNASAGVEVLQFDSTTQPAAQPGATPITSSRGQYVTPVLEIGATYQPFPGTDIKFDARRRTQSSASRAGEDYSSTSIDLAVRQRLIKRVVLGLTGGYENARYFNAISGVNSDRNDDYFYVAPSVDTLLTRYWSIGFYYLRRQNSTTNGGFSFRDNQFGVRSAVAF